MRRLAGTWRGHCTVLDATTGAAVDAFTTTERSVLEGSRASHCHTLQWADGRQHSEELDFSLHEDGRITWDDKFSRGFLTFISDSIALMRVEMSDDDGRTFVGTFTVVEGGKRVKVMHVWKGGKAVEIQHVVQTKI